jgi:hypothetical protein
MEQTFKTGLWSTITGTVSYTLQQRSTFLVIIWQTYRLSTPWCRTAKLKLIIEIDEMGTLKANEHDRYDNIADYRARNVNCWSECTQSDELNELHIESLSNIGNDWACCVLNIITALKSNTILYSSKLCREYLP